MASQDSSHVLETEPEAGISLRLNLIWARDRFSQRISVVTKGQAELILQSVDRDDQEAWPPSPPLQQLLVEDRPNGPVALMVGMAGDSHWSASIEQRSGPNGFRFDVACRIGSQPLRLGSSYLASQLAKSLSSRQLVLGGAKASVLISTQESGPAAAAQVEIAQSQTISIRNSQSAGPPSTIRWMYDITIDNGSNVLLQSNSETQG
jgi:hypothetical protein